MALKGRTIESVGAYIKAGKAKKIVVMVGAGISTSAGIPDFRSPETGLYANLARLDLPYAEAVFAISFFAENPLPFYTLAQELYPGQFRPTPTHCFLKLLHDKGCLLKLFTQNIDCLEREAGVSGDVIVEAHGSFATQSCIGCKEPYAHDAMKEHIRAKTIPHCTECGALVKPDIVFFGEQLPAVFFDNYDVPGQADLCIVLGTSLSVQPFASLHDMTADHVPRLLINKERVGSFGRRKQDVLYLGDCDEGVRRLAAECGWAKDLDRLCRQYCPQGPKESPEDDKLDEIEKLTQDIDRSLAISARHVKDVRKDLESNLNHVFPHLAS